MGSTYINEDAVISLSTRCKYDSNIGFEADFSVNGEHDYWEYYDGIHTFGVWNGFIFGTLYGDFGVIGRTAVFSPVDATFYYTIRIVMKYNPVDPDNPPAQGKIRWVTLADTVFDSAKEKYFDLVTDNTWHTYSINMGPEKNWIGDVNNLRIWPCADGGSDGDEFFIRKIEILSLDTYSCNNVGCSRYLDYENPCPWIGDPGTCESEAHSESAVFNIDDNEELIVNINGYGNERVRIDEVINGTGQEVANKLARAISKTDVGGYAEVEVEYTDDNTFKINSGTRTDGDTVVVVNNDLAQDLKFFDSAGNELATRTVGVDPATGYTPYSSFRAKTFQLYSLFDGSENTGFTFEPTRYSIEGGRRDWQESGLGIAVNSIGSFPGEEESNQIAREYFKIDNVGKTIIDYNHPFNASGRIKLIKLAITLDNLDEPSISKQESTRRAAELSGAKVMIFRPRRDGTMDVVQEFDVPDRDWSGDRVYSVTQETTEIEVDVFVNKGDLLGIYNGNVFIGKSLSGYEIDARYYQISGKPTSNFDPRYLNGDGAAGLLIYARGDAIQDRLAIEVDLQRRYNIENVIVKGDVSSETVEYNYARCLDINWSVDTFGNYHITSHTSTSLPYIYIYYRPNTAFGVNRLNDGVYDVPDGLAMDDYYLTSDYAGITTTVPEAGPGVVPTNPRYFWVNGDEEWLGIWLHAQSFMTNPAVGSVTGAGYPSNGGYDEEELGRVGSFETDPIAFNLNFPFNKEKYIYKSKIYFKEKFNFRSFSISTYIGPYATEGNADDPKYQLVPSYNYITLDGSKYGEDLPNYDQISEYLFKNPCNALAETDTTSQRSYEWDPILSDAIADYGGNPFFIYQEGEVVNYEEWDTARRVDWSIISHEWDPILCRGFRIFTDFHKSTKITEMEVYGVTTDVGSSLPGSITMTYSDYNEYLWDTEPDQVSESTVEIFIGDTPRYLYITLEPVTNVVYTDINVNVQDQDLYLGDKGCEYVQYLSHSRSGGVNQSQKISVENVYERPYDLYVDIRQTVLTDSSLVFYSKLDSEEEVLSPTVGPDVIYRKEFDYELLNQDYNCAINCQCYGLRNLIDGKQAYYSYDRNLPWVDYGELTHGENINFNNIQDTAKTELNLAGDVKARYWKFGMTCPNINMQVREIKCYFEGEEIENVSFGYENRSNPYVGSLTEAPHLGNNSLVGSYYRIYGDERIIIDFGEQKPVDRIVFYHDSLPNYNDGCGVDSTTSLFLGYAEGQYNTNIYDYSYNEHEISKVGTGDIYGDSYDYIITESDIATLTLSGTQASDWEQVNVRYAVYGYYTSTYTEVPATTSGIGYWDVSYQPRWNYVSSAGGNYLAYNLSSFKDSYGSVTVDQLYSLDCRFRINFSSFGSNKTLGIGLINNLSTWNGVGDLGDAATGISVWFDGTGDRVGLAYNWMDPYYFYEDNCSTVGGTSIKSTAGLSTGTDYYCQISYDGPTTRRFRLRIWTDAFEGSSLFVERTLTVSSSHWFNFFRFCIYPAENKFGDSKINFKLYELEINYETRAKKDLFDQPSIYFGGDDSTYLTVPPAYGLSLAHFFYTVEFYMMLEDIPANNEYQYILESYTPTQDWRFRIRGRRLFPGDDIDKNPPRNLTFDYDNPRGETIPKGASRTLPASRGEWIHVCFMRYPDGSDFNTGSALYINGRGLSWSGGTPTTPKDHIFQTLRIGRNFKGWISNLRITTSPDLSGLKSSTRTWFPVPSSHYQQLLNMDVYISDDDINYGEYVGTDLYGAVTGRYYSEDNIFSSIYESFFAIDLSDRYKIDWIRSYGNSDKLSFSKTKNIIYSNQMVSNPADVEFIYDIEMNDSFTQGSYTKPNTTRWLYGTGLPTGHTDPHDEIYNFGNEMRFDFNTSTNLSMLTNYFLIGDFDVRVDWKILNAGTGNYNLRLMAYTLEDVEDYEYYYDIWRRHGDIYRVYYYDKNASSGETKVEKDTTDTSGKFRLVRRSDVLYHYVWEDSSWKLFYQGINISQRDVQIRLYAYSENANMRIAWDNFTVQHGTPIEIPTSDDVRWATLRLINGDGTSRVVRKVGIYPDITNYNAPGETNYNHEWDSLGSSITQYSDGSNVALGTAISGSSFMPGMHFENATDGIIDTDIFRAWGTDDESEQWVLLDLGEVKDIFRFVVYPGYNPDDDRYMINDYQIQTSISGSSFDTVVIVDDNTSFERIHDFADPISVRYIRFYITEYTSNYSLFRNALTGDYVDFNGALVREIEVYEYYGYPQISSEEYPVVAINLNERFNLTGVTAVGIDSQSTATDWDDDPAYLSYSNSTLSDPKKISFDPYGTAPGSEQWVVIKRNTATNYNSGPDYLKNLIVESETKSNFVNFYWWWDSDISALSNTLATESELAVRPLVIEYPASTSLDHVRMRSGTNFGTDSYMGWRDGAGFRFYIDDIDNFDVNEGYFYIGGLDGTNRQNDLEFRWYWSTYSGTEALQSGWNRPFFRFKDADEVIYTESDGTNEEVYPEMPEYMYMKDIGLKVKGLGAPMTLYVDGFVIQRNRFNDYSKFNYGLYLANRDYLTCPIGEIDFSKGTIEFWLRPDYNFNGADIFSRFKTRSIFSFVNNANDVFGMLISSFGLVIYYGNVTNGIEVMTVEGLGAVPALDNLFHFGITFSNNGKNIGIGGSTIRLYINNFFVAASYTTWDINEEKLFKFTLGGKPPLALLEGILSFGVGSVDGVISDFKVYNYCKTDFRDSFEGRTDSDGDLTLSEKFIEISDDNVTFYKVGDPNLPLFYPLVPAGESRDVYVRSIVPDGLTGAENRTSGLVISWDVGV